MSQPTININIGTPTPPPTPVQVQRQSGCLVQLLFFVFIGWWLGGLAVGLAYLLFALVITIPLGVKIINRIPYLMALRQPPIILTSWGQQVQVVQRSLLLRAFWFVLVGWWLAALWMSLAYLLCATLIGMPAGFWLFDKTPGVLTLRRAHGPAAYTIQQV